MNTYSNRLNRDLIYVIGISILTAVFLFLPYLFGYLTTPDGQFYTGLIMNPEDSQTYWAKMQQGLHGSWLYRIPFTTEPHQAAFVGVFYVWLGQLARIAGGSLTAVWHAARFVADVILFVTVYWFIGLFTIDRRTRWVAFLLSLFGSGLGWILFIGQQPYWLEAFPVDFKQPGAHLFFTAMTFPHITLATACILTSTGLMKRAAELPATHPPKTPHWQLTINNWQLAIFLGLSNLILGIAYPFLIYIIAGTAILYGLSLIHQQRKIPWHFGLISGFSFLLPAPLYLYYANTLRLNEVFRTWDIQALTPSAPWPHYLVAFGPYLLLAGLYTWKRPSARPQTTILWCWIFTAALLLYAPLNPQRRFLQGVHVPLSILAAGAVTELLLPSLAGTAGWRRLVARPRYETAKLSRLLLTIFILLMSLSNLYLWSDVLRTAVLVQPDPFFRPADERETIQWLRENNWEDTSLLGAMQTGNLVAAYTGQPVFIGHWAETADYDAKLALATRFFQAPPSPAWRQQFLAEYGIDLVWVGPREQAIGAFDPQIVDFLTPIYHNNSITIYKVKRRAD